MSAGQLMARVGVVVEKALKHSSPARWGRLPRPQFAPHAWDKYKHLDHLPITPLADGRLRHTNMPYVTRGNHLTLYTDGDDMFLSSWTSIAQAQSRVLVEMYSFGNDSVSHRTIRLLADAAKRGVEVKVLYDQLGSRYLLPGFFKPLTDAGADVIPFNPLWDLPWKHDPRFRTHRKTIIVDDHAYIGGMNNSANYAGIRSGGDGRIWDVHLRVQGPAVQHITQSLEHTMIQNEVPTMGFWRWLRKKGYSHGHRPEICLSQPDQLLPVYSVPGLDKILQSSSRRRARKAKSIQRTLYVVLKRARQKVSLATPYFLPQKRLRRAMNRLAERGRRVQVATAGNTDLRFMQWAASYLYSKLVQRGAFISELYHDGRMLHAKAWIIDDNQWSVGSYNLDNTSRRNIELNILSTNPAILQQLRVWIGQTERASQQYKEDHRTTLSKILGKMWNWATYRTVRLWGG